MSLPTLDIGPFLQDPSSASAIQLYADFDRAFSKFGAALFVGHGVTNDLVNSLLAEASDWFEGTSLEGKTTFTHGPYGNPSGGYTQVGIEAVAASLIGKQGKASVDAVESFVFRGLPSTHRKPETSPACPALFATSHADKYLIKIEALRKILHDIASKALGLVDKEYFDKLYDDVGHKNAFRIAHYPEDATGAPAEVVATAAAAGPGMSQAAVGGGGDAVDTFRAQKKPRLRYGAHTDYQDLTILKPDYSDWTARSAALEQEQPAEEAAHGLVPTCGGLQILPRDRTPTSRGTTAISASEADNIPEDAWMPVIIAHDCRPPTLEVPLVVNIGDFWNVWTADRWRSPVHRVTHSGTLLDISLAKQQPPPPQQQQQPKKSRARQALVFFSLPLESASIKPLEGTLLAPASVAAQKGEEKENEGEQTEQVAITAGQHLLNKIMRSNV